MQIFLERKSTAQCVPYWQVKTSAGVVILSNIRCVIELVFWGNYLILFSQFLLEKAIKYCTSDSKNYSEHIFYAILYSTKWTQVYQWMLVNNLWENVCESTHTCTLLVGTLLYYIIVYFYFRRSRVLEERKFTFSVNIKLAPVTVKWAGMPIQLPKLCLSNRKTYEMVRTKLLLIELENIEMYFNLLVNHK